MNYNYQPYPLGEIDLVLNISSSSHILLFYKIKAFIENILGTRNKIYFTRPRDSTYLRSHPIRY